MKELTEAEDIVEFKLYVNLKSTCKSALTGTDYTHITPCTGDILSKDMAKVMDSIILTFVLRNKREHSVKVIHGFLKRKCTYYSRSYSSLIRSLVKEKKLSLQTLVFLVGNTKKVKKSDTPKQLIHDLIPRNIHNPNSLGYARNTSYWHIALKLHGYTISRSNIFNVLRNYDNKTTT